VRRSGPTRSRWRRILPPSRLYLASGQGPPALGGRRRARPHRRCGRRGLPHRLRQL